MDPDQTLRELLAALERRQWDEVSTHAENLLDWLQHKHGFPPLTLGSKNLGRKWHRAVAEFACHAALSKVRDAQKRNEVHDA